MKKTFIITTIAFCFAMVVSKAESEINYETKTSVETISKVSPFCMAVSKGDIVTVKKLIELGSDVNKKSNGMTPAMYAARYNKAEVLKLLIMNGARLNIKSDDGITAKGYAEISNATGALLVIEKAMLRKFRT